MEDVASPETIPPGSSSGDSKQVAALAAAKILRRLRSGNLRSTPDAVQSVRGWWLRKCLLFHHGIRLAYQVTPTYFPTPQPARAFHHQAKSRCDTLKPEPPAGLG